MQYNTSIYLDRRKSSKKINTLFPVKLRLYSNLTKKAKLYPTGIDLSITDFEEIFNSDTKVRGKKKETKILVQRIQSNAEDVAKNLNPFTFETFEKKMFRAKDASINVKYHYQNKIKALKDNKQLSTASNYDLTLKTFDSFLKLKTKTTLKKLTFYDVTVDLLNKYEKYMTNDKERSLTTVSIYLRTLRTIFNDAIRENEIKREIYPFGKGKYQIPQTTQKKQALSKQQLAILFNAEPQTPEQEKAKDFWFFSYACNGMNMKDIALLRYENLNDDTIKYFRAKTINTKKGNLKEIRVFLNDYAKSIIEKYGHKTQTKKQVIFPIFLKDDDVAEQQRKIKNFTSFVNLHFNKLAKNNGFTFKISTYWARHSFATLSIQKGASMEFISDALNHSNLSVTKNYFAGFEDETKKEFAKNLMDF
ncbi:tyrosine-type recombinase/integrase [Kordia jejudonensis]|uniref:tyrosine-type recombinase/integrase n=1 Tax=Kordia jejudonensis TaxID=1348245 RepID=UPI000B02259E|nr:site-specific integrase [Kordia jejudonensis]